VLLHWRYNEVTDAAECADGKRSGALVATAAAESKLEQKKFDNGSPVALY